MNTYFHLNMRILFSVLSQIPYDFRKVLPLRVWLPHLKKQQISPSSFAVDSLDICKTFQVFALSCFPKMTFVLTHEKSPSLMRLKVYVKCRSSINDVALKRNPFLPYNLLSVSKKKNAAMSLQFIHLKYLPK